MEQGKIVMGLGKVAVGQDKVAIDLEKTPGIEKIRQGPGKSRRESGKITVCLEKVATEADTTRIN